MKFLTILFTRKKREREEQKHNPTSKLSFLKLLKDYKQSFKYNCISNLLYKSEMYGLSI